MNKNLKERWTLEESESASNLDSATNLCCALGLIV